MEGPVATNSSSRKKKVSWIRKTLTTFLMNIITWYNLNQCQYTILTFNHPMEKIKIHVHLYLIICLKYNPLYMMLLEVLVWEFYLYVCVRCTFTSQKNQSWVSKSRLLPTTHRIILYYPQPIQLFLFKITNHQWNWNFAQNDHQQNLNFHLHGDP